MPEFTQVADSHPEWKLPRHDADIHRMIRMRQRAQRETNAFPEDTLLSPEEQQEIIKAIPSINEPGAAAKRLAFFIRSGAMNSLDLARAEVEAGDWSVGDKLEKEILTHLNELDANDGLKRKIGIATLKVIDKSGAEANPESSFTGLGDRLIKDSLFWVTRRRLVARLALRNARDAIALIRKVSDFTLNTANDALYQGSDDDELFRMSVQALAGGGFGVDFASRNELSDEVTTEFNERLKQRVREGIERGIVKRAAHLRPLGVSYHVVIKPDEHRLAAPAPLQRPPRES